MTIYSIADLHLSCGDKPMDVFGDNWIDHQARIERDWRERVKQHDVVLLPGDISWAMNLDQAREHLKWICALPGRKILLRGNHDYWWSAVSRVRSALDERAFALQNDSLLLDGVLFAGTRGWLLADCGLEAADEKIYNRELLRLELSLKNARARSESAPLVVMMHFPPLTEQNRDTGFTRLLNQYGAAHLVYGHVHGPSIKGAFRGAWRGVQYHLVSSDALDFSLYRLMDWPDGPSLQTINSACGPD